MITSKKQINNRKRWKGLRKKRKYFSFLEVKKRNTILKYGIVDLYYVRYIDFKG